MREFTFIVQEKFNNFKTDTFLKESGVSLEIIQKVKYGGVYNGNTLVTNVNQTVKTGDVIKIILPADTTNEHLKGVKGNIDIVYEDEYILAVFKPKGVLTHKSRYNKSPSIDELVLGYINKPFVFRAINRLDKDTSGILLIAKDALTASMLGEQMKNGNIIKTYSAVVVGKPEKEHFIIEKPILKEGDGVKRICSKSGKYAKSECFFVKELGCGLSLIDILLFTGRTHQIRVHLSSVGLPLYADSLYGQEVENETYTLHAKSLEFKHPFTGKEIKLNYSLKELL